MLTPVERRSPERDQLIDRLLSEFGLMDVVATACAEAGIEEQEEQVAYCVVVLARKRDPARRKKGTPEAVRTYLLDLDAPGFPSRLAFWAREIARNLVQWGDVYEAIHDDTERCAYTTLAKHVPDHHARDVIAGVIDDMADVLTAGPRLEEMSLDLVRAFEPAGRDYVFWHPLDRWIRTTVWRRLPWDTDPLDGEDGEERRVGTPLAERGDVAQEVLASRFDDRWLADEIARLTAIVKTREPLASLIGRADAYEAALARERPVNHEDDQRLAWLRAALVYEADRLVAERRAVTTMLAYIALATVKAKQLQRVAALSLRTAGIDPEVVDSLATRLRALVDDERHPAPMLVEKTRRARVARARTTTLQRLRAATPERRAATLAPVARMLDGLPPVVDGDDAIAALTGKGKDIVKDKNSVQSVRTEAARELTAVDEVLGRVFRRYAMGKVA
jgi:hypothetical protein